MVLDVFLKILVRVLFCVIKFWTILNQDEPFEKALRSLETCVLANNKLWGKLFSSLESPIIFDERFKVTSIPFFIADFNLLGCELDNFTFNILHWVILY